MEDRVIGKIYATKDYDKFKFICGNRDIKDARVNRIRKSIEKIGLKTPIAVTRRYEIVDGQGRFLVCRLLDIEVYYYFVFDDKAEISEIVSENNSVTRWKNREIIRGLSESGSMAARYLDILISEFSEFDVATVATALIGTTMNQNQVATDIDSMSVTSNDYDNARKKLYYLREATKGLSDTFFGPRKGLYACIMWLYDNDSIDKDRLLKAMKTRGNTIRSATTARLAIEALQDVYNYKLGNGNKRFFADEWKSEKARYIPKGKVK